MDIHIRKLVIINFILMTTYYIINYTDAFETVNGIYKMSKDTRLFNYY